MNSPKFLGSTASSVQSLARYRHNKGLSLLELLVAAAVVAILIAPIVSGLIQHAYKSAGVDKEITLASYIAQNHIAELQLEPKWPSVGNKSGKLEFAGKDWQWEQRVFETDDERLRRVEVTVLYGEDGSWSMTGFVQKVAEQ